jgi:hypothetical protein
VTCREDFPCSSRSASIRAIYLRGARDRRQRRPNRDAYSQPGQ